MFIYSSSISISFEKRKRRKNYFSMKFTCRYLKKNKCLHPSGRSVVQLIDTIRKDYKGN